MKKNKTPIQCNGVEWVGEIISLSIQPERAMILFRDNNVNVR
jgi:hypothetical protein